MARWGLRLIISTSAMASALAQGVAKYPIPEGTKVIRDLEYVPQGHERQKLDLYLPATGERWPLVIAVHGGAFRTGSKEGEPAGAFLSRGFAVASINYRLSQHAKFPAQIEDCKAAVRWLRAHAAQYGYDPDRFGAYGASAGGNLVALLGTAGGVKEFEVGANLEISSCVQAVVDFFGPTDFLQMDAHRPTAATQVHNAPDSPESQLIGGPIQDIPEKTARANPIRYVTREAPPFLIVHGDADLLVPHHQSELLAAALTKAGVPVTFITIPGGPHGGATSSRGMQDALDFLRDKLKRDQVRTATDIVAKWFNLNQTS